jgi:hypothetical protein
MAATTQDNSCTACSTGQYQSSAAHAETRCLDYDDVLTCKSWETLVEGNATGTITRVCLASTTTTTISQTRTTSSTTSQMGTTTTVLDAGVSCNDVERENGEQEAQCGNNTWLIVVIVVVVVLLVAVAGVSLLAHRRSSTGQRRDGDRAYPRTTEAQRHIATKATANKTFDLTGPLRAGLRDDQAERAGRLQPNVYVAGAFLVPTEGSVDSPSPDSVYTESAPEKPALYNATKRTYQSRATPYAQPWADAHPTYAEPIANTNSIQIYTDANGTDIPTFVEHIDGGYSRVQGGQVYAGAADGVSPQECNPMYAREMVAAADTCPTPTGHHHDDMYISIT